MKTQGWIPWARPDYWGNEEKYVGEALRSSWISGGPYVERFETDFAKYSGAPYALTTANGTAALHLALLGLGVGPGDEVIVPGFGFMAAANVSLHVGATPVFADVDPNTWCLTAKEIDKRLTERTKLVVPIHTYGNVCNMPDIMHVVEERGVPILEDAAEALASKSGRQLAGTFGVAGTYSFHATKTITTGEGGMVVTRDQALYDRMSLYRSHGMRRARSWYWHEVVGHNFRLTNLQAALGCAQLERLDVIVQERERVRRTYERFLGGNDAVTLQAFESDVQPVLWACAVKLDLGAYRQGRDEVMKQMQEAQVETRPGFYAASAMSHLYRCGDIPTSEELSRVVISLPFYATLREDQVEHICGTLKDLRR